MANKYLIQCDFDGTVIEEDISFLMLEQYAVGDWHVFDKEYQEGKLNVSQFNEKAFGLVKATPEQLLNFADGKHKLRAGFRELVDFSRKKNIRFMIVSNGFEYYIKDIFQKLGLDVEYHGGQTSFQNNSIKIKYFGPDGKLMESGFKDSYTTKFINEGYRIIYIGDGMSDLSPARRASQVYAIKSLATLCEKNGLAYTPFTDFHDVIKTIKLS